MGSESEGQVAILDTGPLIALHRLAENRKLAFSSLTVLYGQVLVPQQVESEFVKRDPDASVWLLGVFETERSWLHKCSDYSDDIVTIWKGETGIDEGEAGSFAQQQTRGSRHEVILDDKRARARATASQIPHLGFARILARWHLRYGLIDAIEVGQWLRSTGYRIADAVIRDCLKLERQS